MEQIEHPEESDRLSDRRRQVLESLRQVPCISGRELVRENLEGRSTESIFLVDELDPLFPLMLIRQMQRFEKERKGMAFLFLLDGKPLNYSQMNKLARKKLPYLFAAHLFINHPELVSIMNKIMADEGVQQELNEEIRETLETFFQMAARIIRKECEKTCDPQMAVMTPGEIMLDQYFMIAFGPHLSPLRNCAHPAIVMTRLTDLLSLDQSVISESRRLILGRLGMPEMPQNFLFSDEDLLRAIGNLVFCPRPISPAQQAKLKDIGVMLRAGEIARTMGELAFQPGDHSDQIRRLMQELARLPK